MTAVLCQSVPQMVATFDRRARHSAPKPHTPHEECETRSDLRASDQEFRRVIDLVMFGKHDYHGGNEI